MKTLPRRFFYPSLILICALVILTGAPITPVFPQTIIDEWDSVKVQPAPDLKAVKIDPATTALLLLDFNRQTCNPERRPRCIASIPAVQKLLTAAREKNVPVIYSITFGASKNDIAKELAPLEGEPVVTSGPDKFMGTDLEKILKEKGIKSVIVTGTASHGAVLYTASGAALRGMKVIVPVDGMSAENTYAEQYVTWHLANAPRVSNQVTITKIEWITF
jgi:nicotinamidase-related amidase